MNEQELKTITVLIAGKSFPLKIDAADELLIRQIEKEVNDRVNQLQMMYKNKDKLDYLCMIALTYAVDLYKSESSHAQQAVLASQLSSIDAFLDKAVS
jgi:cell division protein ZapA